MFLGLKALLGLGLRREARKLSTSKGRDQGRVARSPGSRGLTCIPPQAHAAASCVQALPDMCDNHMPETWDTHDLNLHF